ncbi:unnamed protein product [Bursaphelenchus xylophilus]|nr:unnamed protein product [Bursaphelenchus xylophilus]CAG9094176.1 unnamed protein product [Bursaphelenchus xylophilus]
MYELELAIVNELLIYSCIATSVLTAYFFWKIYTSQRIHKNLKLVLCLTTAAFIATSTSHHLEVLAVKYAQDSSNRVLSNGLCAVVSVVHTISLLSASSCMNMLTVEQHFATIWVDDYENRSMKVGIILMAVVFFQTVPFGIFLNWYFFHGWFSLAENRSGCLVTDREPRLSFFFFIVGAISSSICAVYTYILYRQNVSQMRERVNLKSLTARYQQFENSTWAYSICVSFVMYFMLVAGGVTMWTWYYMTDQSKGGDDGLPVLLSQLGYVQADVFSLLHMLGIMYFNKFIRSAVVKDLQALRIIGKTARPMKVKQHVGEADEYFNQFQQAWR